MTMQPVNYSDGDVHLSGFLAWDATRTEKRPGILVVHGGRGLDDHAKGRARQLAEMGFVATLVLIRTRDSRAHLEMARAEVAPAEVVPA